MYSNRNKERSMRVIFFVLLALLLSACSRTDSGLQEEYFDPSYRPQDDLYRYVNGKWLKTVKIPKDKSNYGLFSELQERNEKHLHEIVEELARSGQKTGSDKQKVADFYKSFMDSARIESLGIRPIAGDLQQIKALTTRSELIKEMARLRKMSVRLPFSFYVGQDQKHSSRYIVYLGQSGLGLPDRDYYLRTSPKFEQFRREYVAYISKIFTLGGISDAQKKAQKILEMETEMARAQWSRVQNRQREKTYNKFGFGALAEMAPQFDWKNFFEACELKFDSLIVSQPSYLKAFGKIFAGYSVDDWKDFLTYKTIQSFGGYLSSDFVKTNFEFYGRALTGTPQLSPRWKRAMGTMNGLIGQLLGKMYVEKYFPPEAKKRMKEMVRYLRLAYADRIKQLPWMSAQTKQKALEKLAKFNAKIGYPDKWKDYAALSVKADDLVGNVKRARLFLYYDNIRRLGRPVDRKEWFMNPQTVNAYYSASMNEVVFPAGILQPPFFNLNADDAANYGGIGAVIGHEITHGFDDQGSKSDGDGNLNNWWTEEDRKNFEKRAQKLVEQFSRYVVVDTMHLNGKLTLGENIADLGGVTIAYHAYHKSLQGKEAPVLDGFSGDQRFFMGWAQIWKRKYRKDELRRRVLTDPHSPSAFRVNGVVVNVPEFYEAFHVTANDSLYLPPEQRVQIW
jgi:endothelin-converting enzyme/putative endopeptidase